MAGRHPRLSIISRCILDAIAKVDIGGLLACMFCFVIESKAWSHCIALRKAHLAMHTGRHAFSCQEEVHSPFLEVPLAGSCWALAIGFMLCRYMHAITDSLTLLHAVQNHCCAPSMYTKVLEIDRRPRLVFFARFDIRPGQELTYDYRFKEEEGENKLPCGCGAPNCRGTLN